MDLAGTSWTVQQLRGRPVPHGVRLSLELGTDGTVSGSAGVNGYRSWFTVAEDVLTVGDLMMTRKGGPPVRRELEAALVDLLSSPCALARDGARLLLDTDTVLVPDVPVG